MYHGTLIGTKVLFSLKADDRFLSQKPLYQNKFGRCMISACNFRDKNMRMRCFKAPLFQHCDMIKFRANLNSVKFLLFVTKMLSNRAKRRDIQVEIKLEIVKRYKAVNICTN